MICVFSTHTCDPILNAQGEKYSDIYRGENVTSYCQDYVKGSIKKRMFWYIEKQLF